MLESPVFSILQQNKNEKLKVFTLNNKIYRGILEDFDMSANVCLRDGYEKIGDNEETFVGEVLVNGSSIAFFDIL
jgi:small nuclear ribonucleoprotein (snRNP)-like protein